MESILIWYTDYNGDYHLEMTQKPKNDLLLTFLQEFSKKSAVNTVLEAYTVSHVHEIFGRTSRIEYIETKIPGD